MWNGSVFSLDKGYSTNWCNKASARWTNLVEIATVNTFLFTSKTVNKFNIICDDNTTTCRVNGSGIIQLRPPCAIQTSDYEIVSVNHIELATMDIIIPSVNISDILIEMATISKEDNNHSTAPDDIKMAILQNAIIHQRNLLKSVYNHDIHNTHHYIMIYSIVFMLIRAKGQAWAKGNWKKKREHTTERGNIWKP